MILRFPAKEWPRRFRTAWISEVHLGTCGSNPAALLEFLSDYEFETLYIVGDIYWPQQHSGNIQKILRKARKRMRIVYIPGNRDELLGEFYGAYGNITIQKHAFTAWPLVVACSSSMVTNSTRSRKT